MKQDAVKNVFSWCSSWKLTWPRYRACIDVAISSKRKGTIQVQRWRSEGTELACGWSPMDQSRNCSLTQEKSKNKKKVFLCLHRKWGVKRFCEIRFPWTWKGKRSIHNTIYLEMMKFRKRMPTAMQKNTARPFVRTKPSSLERWLKQTKSEDPKWSI